LASAWRCQRPLAAELALRPIRRYAFDGPMLFSDILEVTDALGQTVTFVAGGGLRLEPKILIRRRPGEAEGSAHEGACLALVRLGARVDQ
jgi:hypothetical protein